MPFWKGGALMPRVVIPKLLPASPSAGVHIARIVEVKESVSEAGNAMWSILARFANREELRFRVTFTNSPKGQRLVVYFARSLDLILPDEPGAQVDLSAADVKNRVF